jgi:predicted Zn finger-like uncharacterized protein
MQAACPQCSNKMVIDDAKVPDRPFSVKCPRCQSLVKLPGRATEPAPVEEPDEPGMPPPPAPAAGPAPEVDEARAQMLAQVRREMAAGGAPQGRALVALPDRGLAGAVTLALTRQGLQVDSLDTVEEGARLLEQGIYEVVVTARVAGAAGKGESLYQRMNRLSPEGRRRIFLVLVGEEFKSGDGTQAFTTLADLVVHSRDLGGADGLLHAAVAERNRLYHAFLEARRRFEAIAATN